MIRTYTCTKRTRDQVKVQGRWVNGSITRHEQDAGRVQIHCVDAELEDDGWVPVDGDRLRQKTEHGGLGGFTPLMCACTLENEEKVRQGGSCVCFWVCVCVCVCVCD
jgi:hypothetical protein